MDSAKLPPNYKDTLLYRSCKSEAEYLQLRLQIDAAKRRRLHTPAPDIYGGSHARDAPLPPAVVTDLARLAAVIKAYPNELRALFLDIVLDIVDEFRAHQNGLES